LSHVDALTANDAEPLVRKIALTGPQAFYLATGWLSDGAFVQRWRDSANAAATQQQMRQIRARYGIDECPPLAGNRQ
jgi:hypothetical protein